MPFRFRSFSSLSKIYFVTPFSMSIGYTFTAEGLFFATSSISTPPSFEATIAGRWLFLSKMKAR